MTEGIKPFDVFLGSEWQEFQSKGLSMANKFVNCVTPDPEEVESAIEEMYSVWEKYRHALEKYHQFLKQAEKSASQVKSEKSSSQPKTSHVLTPAKPVRKNKGKKRKIEELSDVKTDFDQKPILKTPGIANRVKQKALPKVDSMTLCPMCDQIVSSRSQQIYEEHVRICVERNSGEDSALFKGNDAIIGSKQMRTRRSRDGPSMTPISKNTVPTKPQTTPNLKVSKPGSSRKKSKSKTKPVPKILEMFKKKNKDENAPKMPNLLADSILIEDSPEKVRCENEKPTEKIPELISDTIPARNNEKPSTSKSFSNDQAPIKKRNEEDDIPGLEPVLPASGICSFDDSTDQSGQSVSARPSKSMKKRRPLSQRQLPVQSKDSDLTDSAMSEDSDPEFLDHSIFRSRFD